MVSARVRWWMGAFAFGALFVAIPTVISPSDIINPGSAEGDFALGMVQLVALVIPALAIFTQALLQFSYRRGEQRGKSGGLGPFGPDLLRGGVVTTAGISTLLLSMGLASLLVSIQLPDGVKIGTGLIVVGIAFMPAIVICFGLLILLESQK